MAELADALDSGSNERKLMEVQVLLSAPNSEAFVYTRASEFFRSVLLAKRAAV